MCPAVKIRSMQSLRLYTSILDPGGPRGLPTAMGEHTSPPRLPPGVPRLGLHSLALLPATEVTRNGNLHVK